jgi:hypothetical protein
MRALSLIALSLFLIIVVSTHTWTDPPVRDRAAAL